MQWMAKVGTRCVLAARRRRVQRPARHPARPVRRPPGHRTIAGERVAREKGPVGPRADPALVLLASHAGAPLARPGGLLHPGPIVGIGLGCAPSPRAAASALSFRLPHRHRPAVSGASGFRSSPWRRAGLRLAALGPLLPCPLVALARATAPTGPGTAWRLRRLGGRDAGVSSGGGRSPAGRGACYHRHPSRPAGRAPGPGGAPHAGPPRVPILPVP